jgi:hypothetical protein
LTQAVPTPPAGQASEAAEAAGAAWAAEAQPLVEAGALAAWVVVEAAAAPVAWAVLPRAARPSVALLSAAAWAFRRDQVLPSLAPPPAVLVAHAMARWRIASR